MIGITLKVRPARLKHVDRIYELIESEKFCEDGSGNLIPLDKEEIRDLVRGRRFFVAYVNGFVVGCASVIDYEFDGEWVAELRSVVVNPEYRRRGISKTLNGHGRGLAKKLGYPELYALINEEAFPAFFSSGFKFVAYRPIQKIQRDCVRCPFYNNGCKESTVVAYLQGMQ